ncbi:MAG TPA: zf-HC2 domain-containing protein [Spirochaetes bacterium]|nr:zf-HC2 domain-containing protein [Spirochaetota bacterium]
MKCKKIRRGLHRLLDGEPVDARGKKRIERHLAQCAPCREYNEELRIMGQLLSRAGAIEAGTAPVDRLMGAYRAALNATANAGRPAGISLDRLVAAAAAMAAVIIMAVSYRIVRGESVDPVRSYLLQSVGTREVLYLSGNDWTAIP